MISRLVLDAFRRLAGSSVAMDIAKEVRENFQAAEKGQAEVGAAALPSAEQVDMFWDALADADPSIREMRESAAGDKDERKALRSVIEDVLENIARGVTNAGSEMTRLVNHCRMLLSKRVAKEDRETKSRGLTESLRGFAGRAEGKALGDDMAAFVRETFSGEISRLADEYLSSRPHGGGLSRERLLVQQTGSGAAARRQAEGQVFAMLYGLVAGRVGLMRAGTYKPKYADPATEDLMSFNSVVSSVLKNIHHDKVDDQFAPSKTGLETPRTKWRRYVEPLRGSEMYDVHPDLAVILDWINANFHRPALDSQEPVTVGLPGGGSVTAPSFKRKLTMEDLKRWHMASQGVSSLDAPISAESDGGTVGESVGKQDQDVEDREEYKTEYLSDPENNARIRRKLEAAIREAAATVPVRATKSGVKGISSSNLRKMYEMVLLIKLGFASKPEAKAKFAKEWRESAIVDKDGRAIMPHIPFRTELMDEKLWRKLGRPLRKGWEQDEDQRPHELYRFPWTQKMLVRKDTGEAPKDIREMRNDPDPEHWKIVNVRHTTAEKPKVEHFVNWVPYTEESRDADIRNTLDAYDGDEWFRLSLRPEAQRAMKESLDDENPLKNFKPENVFAPFAKNTDWPMFRAMGQTRLSVSPQPDSLYHGLSGPAADMKAVTRELAMIITQRMKDDPDAPWLLTYITQKGEGKVASRIRPSRAASVVDIESMVLSVVNNILSL